MKIKLKLLCALVIGGGLILTTSFASAVVELDITCSTDPNADPRLWCDGFTGNSASNGTLTQQPANSSNLNYIPLEPLPGVPQGGQASFADLITGFFKLLVNLGAFIAVTVLVIAGITYMLSEATVKKYVAREKIKAAFFGMAILAAAWLILNTINPQLLQFNRNLIESVTNAPSQNRGAGFNNSANIGKFTDDCEAGGGRVDTTPSGLTCTK